MTFWRLVGKEILHRKLNFALGVLSVAVAVGVLVAEFTLLRAHDVCTEQALQHKADEAHQRLAKMEDDYRKYMKELGFNLLILPKEQNLAEFWEKGFASQTMPLEHVATLSNSGTVLIQHLLPVVQQKILWPEQKRRIILIGTRGEVPVAHRGPKEPMLLAVPIGQAVVGHEIAADLGLKPGGKIKLLGRDLLVQKCRSELGSAEDATIWVDLAAAQEMLEMPGRINGIEALQCLCKGVSIPQIKAEVAKILHDDVKVIVRENKVTLRAKARERAGVEHVQALAAERSSRDRLRKTRESFAAVLVPLVLLGSGVWIGFLALSNVRERSAEIGILRAIGLRARGVFYVFLTKALVIGLLGAVAGYAAGLGVSVVTSRLAESMRVGHAAVLFAPGLLAAVLLASPLLSALASWAPATLAARQDPAVILAKE